jgi:hypothetical protein
MVDYAGEIILSQAAGVMAVPRCRRDGCENEATRAGFCSSDYNRDYRRRRKAGEINPRKIATRGMTRRERFEHIGYDVMPDGCWRWRGSIVNGYARIVRGNGDSATVASRVAWMIYRGPIASGLFVHHKCANRACVNPDHLELTSTRENQAEMMQRRYYLSRIAELEAEVAELKERLLAYER